MSRKLRVFDDEHMKMHNLVLKFKATEEDKIENKLHPLCPVYRKRETVKVKPIVSQLSFQSVKNRVAVEGVTFKIQDDE